MEKNRLQDFRLHRSWSRPERRRYEPEKAFLTYGELSRKVLDSLGRGEGDVLRMLIFDASTECKGGVAILSDKVIAIGRKKA